MQEAPYIRQQPKFFKESTTKIIMLFLRLGEGWTGISGIWLQLLGEASGLADLSLLSRLYIPSNFEYTPQYVAHGTLWVRQNNF